MLQQGKLGVHPPGALGVAFFIHTDASCLIGRGGDGITSALIDQGLLRLQSEGKMRIVSLQGRIYANLMEADALNGLPELLFVCCNPDQLDLFTGDVVGYLESLADRGKLKSIEDVHNRVPILMVLPNGVLFELTMRTYEEQLHEAMLLNRLKGVTKQMVDALLERVVRGVSLQAGGRRGSGSDTVYVLENKGTLVFADGGAEARDRIDSILAAHGYPCKQVRGVPGTRIEFDKAMISIVLNVGGLIHTTEPNGKLIDLRMGDLCNDPTKADFVDTVTRAVFEVGQAVGAYPDHLSYTDVWSKHLKTIIANKGHVTSSLKSFRDALGHNLNGVRLFSNEEWLLTPLSKYASNAGLKKHEALFHSLKKQVQASMARAIRFRDEHPEEGFSETKTMNLTDQRNISIELYDSGPDHLLLVGTMLDQEHLVKLQMGVNLSNEQITTCKIQMIRAPFPVCREVESLAERLIGLRIQRGVINAINERLAGRVGCSHIKELANSIIYFVASHLVRQRAGVDPMSTDYALKPPEERFSMTRELLRDSCLAYCQTTPHLLDERIGIRRIGDEQISHIELGEFEPSLGRIMLDRARRWGTRDYIRYRINDCLHSISWDSFAQQVSQIARHLMDQGIGHGNRIVMLSENRVEMFMFELATMSIGATTVPIFAGYPAGDVAYLIGHSRPRLVVVSGAHQLEKIDRKQYPWIQQYFCMDFDAQAREWGATEFSTLLEEGGASMEALERQINEITPDTLGFIMYTSGTTGPPKGVKLSHGNIISQQKAITHLWDVSENDVVMNYLPWHHSFGGLFERFMTLYHGCTLCLDDSRGRDIDRLIDNWNEYRPTLFFSVPRVHDLLVTRCQEDPRTRELVFGGGLRFVFTAGAALSAPVASEYRQHGIPVLEGWGLTETSPCATMTTKESPWQSGSVGFPIPGVKIRIDSNQEILVKGPNVMSGYLDDEEASSRVIDETGWFHTGDLGEFTKTGLRLYGRKDGAFKLTTGEKVHPQRVENILVNESSYISAAIAFGSGKDHVCALIYPDFNKLRRWAEKHGLADDDLTNHPRVRELYAAELGRINPMITVKYQRVHRAIVADRELSLEAGELTPSGKIARRSVFNNNKRAIESLFAAKPTGDVIEVGELQRTS
ncbi:MAG: AMP-binding protein [Planctomycetota bacterium]|jgi:long-subunit acyl-CoA synthetase (AMP-forming)